MWTVARCLVALAVLLVAACSTPLPDPESPGAQLYAARCSGCHRLYAPGVLTAAMWELQMDRMQAEMARRGVRPLDATERDLVWRYLQAHATDAAPAGASE
jgi:mono/diheme cytochrome c family protein